MTEKRDPESCSKVVGQRKDLMDHMDQGEEYAINITGLGKHATVLFTRVSPIECSKGARVIEFARFFRERDGRTGIIAGR
jgi:hypothetical protein